LFGDQSTEAIVIRQKLTDEFMQAAPEYLIAAIVEQMRISRAREALRSPLMAMVLTDAVKIARDILITRNQRARHLPAYHKEVHHKPRFYAFAINPVIGCQRGYRAQDRRPLEIIERAANLFRLWQKNMIFHIENARGIVGTFNIKSKSVEPVGFVAQHGAIGRAVELARNCFDEFQKPIDILP